MKIHELPKDPGRQQKKKRVGRGESSGRGRTAGKGNKGHKARSGGTQKAPYFEGGQIPITRRLPKFGFSNETFRTSYEVVNLGTLDELFEAGATIDIEALKAARLVRTGKPVKVLGTGELTKALTVKVNAFSKSASEKIAAAGGTAEVV